MATVDVASLVSSVYTPTLLVPTDGSTFTQALLTNLVVSLANRTEYLRDAVPDASVSPERFFTIREDFQGAIWTAGQARLDASFPWRTGGDTGVISVNGVAGSAKNPGQLHVFIPGNGTDLDFYMQPHGEDDVLSSFARFRHATFVMKVNDHASNANTQALFRICEDNSLPNGGDDCINIGYVRALDAVNWKCSVRKAGVTVVNFTTIAPLVNNQFITVHLDRASSTSDIEVRINSGASPVLTIANADVPTVSCTFGMYASTSTLDSETFETSVDLMSLRADTIAREGV